MSICYDEAGKEGCQDSFTIQRRFHSCKIQVDRECCCQCLISLDLALLFLRCDLMEMAKRLMTCPRCNLYIDCTSHVGAPRVHVLTSLYPRYSPLDRILPPSTAKPAASNSATPAVKQEVKMEVKSEPGTSNGSNGASTSGSGSTEKGPLHGMKFTIVGMSVMLVQVDRRSRVCGVGVSESLAYISHHSSTILPS